ncbi:hypothetical protein [Marinifilum sp.]|uniref:hypothetical protein n=1 Tax=Marinifilum sp. TaxID=2033137 RepID=UPI003BAB6856
MYYDIVNQMDDDEASDYDWEIVDGKPRYRWYKYALNSVYMISSVDEKCNIETVSFDDLDAWYECVNWVAKNDPEALMHIMSKLVDPVNPIVKTKLLESLEKSEYYSACLIVDTHLRIKEEPKERDFNRKKEKYSKIADEDIAKQLIGMSQILHSLKTTAKNKLYEEKLQEPISYLLNIEKFARTKTNKFIETLQWMIENAPEDLKRIFNTEIQIEIRDNFLNYFAEREHYQLCSFMMKCIPVIETDFYFDIPPYKDEYDDEAYFGEDEDEDEELDD